VHGRGRDEDYSSLRPAAAPALSGTQSVGEADPAQILALLGIAILLGSYVINAMDRQLFPLILPEVRREYGFNLPEAGLISTVFTIGMALAGLPTGYLMSRYARKSVAQIGICIFSAATIVTVLAAGFTDMLIYRGLTGMGEAMQLTACSLFFQAILRAIAPPALARSALLMAREQCLAPC